MTKNEQIDGIFSVIDLWASNAVRKRPDGASVYNPYNAKQLAVDLYNAGYRKIDDNCTVITKDELKQYKVQAVQEFADELKAMCSDYLYDTNFDGKNDFDIHIGELSRMIDELLKEYEK